MILDDEIINLLKNDDNAFFDYYNKLGLWERNKMAKYIFKYNLKNIALNIIKSDDRPRIMVIYNVLIKQYLEKKNKLLLLFILNSLLYVNDIYYPRLIYRFAKNGLWEIVDYLHMMGYTAFNKKKLIDIYPKNKIEELDKYGYDVYKKDDIIYDDIFIKKYKKKDKITITKLCKEQNIDILQKLIDIKHIKLSINDLLILCQINNNKTKKRQSRWKRRRAVFKKYNKILNNIVSDDIIHFIRKNKDNIIVKKNKLFTLFCIKYKLYELFDKKIFVFTNFMMKRIYWYIFENDNVDVLKYMIENNIIRPIDIYNNKYMDVNDAITCDKPNLLKYFYEELKMSYNNSIFFWCYNHTKKNVMTHIKELEKFGFKNDNPLLLNFTAKIGSVELYNYIDKTKLKFKGKHVIIALSNNNFKLAKILIKNGCKINKNKMLNQIINSSNYYGCYARNINYDKIIKNYDCYIDEKNLFKIINILDYTTIIFLYNKNKNLFNNADIELFTYYIFSDYKIYNELEEIYDYILFQTQTKYDDVHKLEIYERILLNCLDSCIKYDIIEKFIEKINFKLTSDFCKRIYFVDNSHILKFIKLMEKHNIIMDDDMIYYIFIHFFNEECAEYLINKYNFKGSLKLLNNMVSESLKHDIHLNFIKFMIERMNINPTPYTTELLITQFYYYGYTDNEILLYIIKKTGLTQKSYENINKCKYMKILKNNINKYKIIDYQPLDEEIIYINENDDIEIISEPDDELEKAIQDGLKMS
jgi:hypothetical protein